jgi:hypothetical protein
MQPKHKPEQHEEGPMGDPQPSPDRILQLATGAWGTGILSSGVIHSIFTHLAVGAARTEIVAQRAGLSERGTQVLLDGLVGLGLVDVIDGNYRNSPEASEFLVEGKPAYTGGYVKFTFADMSRWAGMPEAVRTGAPLATDTADVTLRPAHPSGCSQRGGDRDRTEAQHPRDPNPRGRHTHTMPG